VFPEYLSLSTLQELVSFNLPFMNSVSRLYPAEKVFQSANFTLCWVIKFNLVLAIFEIDSDNGSLFRLSANK